VHGRESLERELRRLARKSLQAVGNDKIGTARGDYAIGFEAFALDGRQIRGTFATPEQAAEVLALEVSLSGLWLTA
jgi:hypothetical protein